MLCILPKELLLYNIFTYLNAIDLKNCRLISKSINRIASDDHLWKILCVSKYNFIQSFLSEESLLWMKHHLILENRKEEHLPLSVEYCNAEDYNSFYGISNLLAKSRTAFCTKKKSTNVDILIKSEFPFVLTSYTIVSPSNWYTAPVNSGLVFVFENAPLKDCTFTYDNFTRSQYETLQPSQGITPVSGFFDIAKTTANVKVNPYRSGKYILLKLLDSAGNKVNIDIEYAQFNGYTLSPKGHSDKIR